PPHEGEGQAEQHVPLGILRRCEELLLEPGPGRVAVGRGAPMVTLYLVGAREAQSPGPGITVERGRREPGEQRALLVAERQVWVVSATGVGWSTPAGGCASAVRAPFRSPRASWIITRS